MRWATTVAAAFPELSSAQTIEMLLHGKAREVEGGRDVWSYPFCGESCETLHRSPRLNADFLRLVNVPSGRFSALKRTARLGMVIHLLAPTCRIRLPREELGGPLLRTGDSA